VPVDDIDGLATAMTKLLSDPKRLQAYSKQAYQDAKRYSTTAVWAQWQPLMQAAAKFYQSESGAGK